MAPLLNNMPLAASNDEVFLGADKFSTRPVLSIVVLGVAKTGKSSFISYLTKDFKPSTQFEKDITLKRRIEQREDKENEYFKLCIYETNSLERFHSITKGYHRKWDVVFVLYNSNFVYSIKRAAKWLADIRSHGSQTPKLVLVENTFDIDYPTKLTELEMQELNTVLQQLQIEHLQQYQLGDQQTIADIISQIPGKQVGLSGKALVESTERNKQEAEESSRPEPVAEPV